MNSNDVLVTVTHWSIGVCRVANQEILLAYLVLGLIYSCITWAFLSFISPFNPNCWFFLISTKQSCFAIIWHTWYRRWNVLNTWRYFIRCSNILICQMILPSKLLINLRWFSNLLLLRGSVEWYPHFWVWI